MKKNIDILVPLYNESLSIEIFWNSRLKPVLTSLSDQYDFKVIFLNNASTDDTFQKLKNIRKESAIVEFVTYTRNIGYQNSLLGGLGLSTGHAVIVIDSDGEDPPSLIADFLVYFERGFHVVYGDRRNRKEVFWMKHLRKIFYLIMNYAADVEVVRDMAEFSLMSKDCKAYILHASRNNSFPFIRAETARSGLSRIGIPYTRENRIGGQSNYNLLSSFKFAIAAFLTASTLPLRILGILGPLLFLVGTMGYVFGFFEFVRFIFISYLVLIGGFVSLYTARIYVNHLDRPRFIIDTKKSTLLDVQS